MEKHPHGVDTLKKCLDPNQRFIDSYCKSQAEGAETRYWVREHSKSESNKKNL